MRRGTLVRGIGALCIGAAALAASLARADSPGDDPAPVTPAEHRRGADQTFLTYPEWFLVFSPAEYADFVRESPPGEFPFLGHIRQFWQGYGAVREVTKDTRPPNYGYHAMNMVIGLSTTGEYGLRSAYETLVGRLTELLRRGPRTAEDVFAARVAQEYVEFIRVRPWYEFDFLGRLRLLWTETPMTGGDMLRKWERRYILTTEYAGKAIYGWLIGKLTGAAYEAESTVTAVVVDRLPPGIESLLPELKVLERFPDGSALITVPRYEAFRDCSIELARRGARFREIAGNRGAIMVSALVPVEWEPGAAARPFRILFAQPVLTRPSVRRIVVAVPVGSLDAALGELNRPPLRVEHVYDY